MKMVANTALDMGEIMVKMAEKPPKSTDVSCWWKLNSEEWKFSEETYNQSNEC